MGGVTSVSVRFFPGSRLIGLEIGDLGRRIEDVVRHRTLLLPHQLSLKLPIFGHLLNQFIQFILEVAILLKGTELAFQISDVIVQFAEFVGGQLLAGL